MHTRRSHLEITSGVAAGVPLGGLTWGGVTPAGQHMRVLSGEGRLQGSPHSRVTLRVPGTVAGAPADTTVWGHQRLALTPPHTHRGRQGWGDHPGGPQRRARRGQRGANRAKTGGASLLVLGDLVVSGRHPYAPPFLGTPPTACACRCLHVLVLPWDHLVQPQGHWSCSQWPWMCPASLGCPVLGWSRCGSSGVLLLCQGEGPEPPVQGVALQRDSFRCPKPAR